MSYYRFFKKKIYIQNNIPYSRELLTNIQKRKVMFNNNVFFEHNNNPALYNFSTNYINIPENFYRSKSNHDIFNSIEKYFGDKSLDFIILHEIGHLNNHQFLSLHLNRHTQNFEYAILNSKSNYIKTNTSLENLFDRTLSKDSPIDDFIHMNFTESYADAYAGVISFIKDKDISIFDKIYQFRNENLNKIKTYNGFNPKLNNSNLEISAGQFATSRYNNVESSTYIRDNIVNIFSHNFLQNMSFSNLHSLIQIEVLNSLKDTILKEANDNILFNNDLHHFFTHKNITIKDYMQNFEIGIKNYKENTIKDILHEDFFNKSQNYLNNLIDFHSKNNTFTQFNSQSSLLTLEEESQIFNYVSNFRQQNTLEQNRAQFTKFIIGNLIFKSNEIALLITELSSQNPSNPKFNEIIKSLEPDLIQSLIKYNNLSINTTLIPPVNNYSQQELIDIITKDLSVKNKKQFLDYIEKNNIKEITTAYLSSSDFNVANDNVVGKQFQPKSLSEILSKIIDIEKKIKPHNEFNQHEAQKIKIK